MHAMERHGVFVNLINGYGVMKRYLTRHFE
jgi:hypothetical protein